jgi:hypothetical protein
MPRTADRSERRRRVMSLAPGKGAQRRNRGYANKRSPASLPKAPRAGAAGARETKRRRSRSARNKAQAQPERKKQSPGAAGAQKTKRAKNKAQAHTKTAPVSASNQTKGNPSRTSLMYSSSSFAQTARSDSCFTRTSLSFSLS